MIRKALIGTVIVCLAASPGLASDEQQASHIVRPGDTFRALTRQYLGTESRWQENWRLNPQIEDPNVLTPGQRIRILVPRTESPVPTARVLMVSGEVDERPAPVDWLGAQNDDLLLERDGIRTGEASSSVLRFTDGTELALIESSRVILARAGRSLAGVDERSVEILEGQAELASVERGAPAADIEIVIGGAVTKPQIGASGELQARARRQQSGGAAVMMYEGSGEVEADGQTVEVETGMGTAVPEEGPPSPPEKLLPAPAAVAPAAGARLPYPDPEIAWSEVAGAASYTLELCRDAECRQAYLRRTGLTATSWRASPLEVTGHHWRVSAVSPSGLDGYPSPASAFTVLSDRRDQEAPIAAFELEGPAVEGRAGTFYAPSARVKVTVSDEPAGVASWRPLIDGRPGSEAQLDGPWNDGAHAVDAAVADRFDNEATREGPRFTVDAEPPRLLWDVGAEEVLERVRAKVERPQRWQRRWRSWHQRARRELRRHGADPALWALVAWNTEAFAEVGADWSVDTLRWRERRRHQTVSHAGGSPAMLIVAPRLAVPGAEEGLGERMLLVRVVDDEAGARSLSLRTTTGAGGPELEVETLDRLGNRRVERLVFLAPER